ncbi:response regulator [Spirosoma pollinicola]|uniref:Response regulator rcp1 n=1 Tax=Spirosoma pollinicola TaxID=2057025 RepID=A0A2K8Z8X5_9BACT|nr:response regulator [Spirosoma pollinicola]AUD06315.1 response regulator rcp1 [Spirosoma pollinicola]
MDRKYDLSYIVVDDEDDRYFLRLALEQAHRPLPVYEFTNGQELLDYLTYNASIRQDLDNHWLVVLDVNMPILNGLETLKCIRQNPAWQMLPVLILSTSDNPSMRQQALEEGANGYLVKPTSLTSYASLFDDFFAPWLQKTRL